MKNSKVAKGIGLVLWAGLLAGATGVAQAPQGVPGAGAPGAGAPGAGAPGGVAGQGRARGGAGAQRPDALPQMPANGGDVNRDALIGAARASLDVLKSGDVAGYEGMITDDAVIVSADGLERKSDLVKRLADFKLKDYTMSDARFVPMSPDNGVVSFTLTESGTDHGKPFTAKMNVSSVWERGGGGGFGRGGYLCVFEQETPVK